MRIFLLMYLTAGLFIAPAKADVIIQNDIGGRIQKYVEWFTAVRNAGERVVIVGDCLSACTLVTGIVPDNRICITRRAILGFHAAWVPGPHGEILLSQEDTYAMWRMYPKKIQDWIRKRGALLSLKMYYLQGIVLAAMYPQCP